MTIAPPRQDRLLADKSLNAGGGGAYASEAAWERAARRADSATASLGNAATVQQLKTIYDD